MSSTSRIAFLNELADLMDEYDVYSIDADMGPWDTTRLVVDFRGGKNSEVCITTGYATPTEFREKANELENKS